MRFSVSTLGVCLLTALTARAQSYCQIAAPGITIGGHKFTKDTVIGNVAVNNDGEVAFVAQWRQHGRSTAAVFTSKRVVARQGDTFGGAFIHDIPLDSEVQIANSGLVSYTAGTGEGKAPSRPRLHPSGIFVEDRYVGPPPRDSSGERASYRLDDRGSIHFRDGVGTIGKGAQTTARSFWGRFNPRHIFTIKVVARPAFHEGYDLLLQRPVFPEPGFTASNARGQRVFAENLTPSGFIILLSEAK